MPGKKIVTIGGGTGSFTVLSGLKNTDFDISAIVSMIDDGGSTGRLRDELGVLPPGDVRQCLVALSEESKAMRDIFNYRFDSGGLKGHSLGNLFISALEKKYGSFVKGLEVAMKILNIKGKIIPASTSDTKLFLEFKNGDILKGENEIYESGNLKRKKITKLYLKPKAQANEKAIEAINEADLIVICPGNLYCSLVPGFLPSGMAEAIEKAKGKVVYIANLVNKKGQTDDFTVEDYVAVLNDCIGSDRIDYVLYNAAKPEKELEKKYKEEGETLVELANKENRSYKLVEADLLNNKTEKRSNADALAARRSLIRHDSQKVARVVEYLANMEEYQNLIKKIR
ncbi:MAG: gluconeogenesis factor YvcK family protein [Candidatus Moranbacteria bacterium]|nr:gluconeogenesis factor YvcK family protein [Candidatus Moranbacteria bacterium]